VKSSGRYVVEAESKTLYELLRKPVNLDRLRRYIEHCERCVSAFLRGFAYSEGNVDKSGYIYIYNTDLRLLTYIHGSYDPRRGKKYTHNKDCHRIHIRASSNANSYKYIGFTIKRKQQRLEEYIRRTTSTPTPPPTISPTLNILKIITNIAGGGI
jgi:intein-encoded DNA endonuclease-like protein